MINQGAGGICDSHVHFLPGRLAEKVRAFFRLGGFENLVYPIDHIDVSERLASEGVTEVWSLPYAHKPGVAVWLNEASTETANADLAVKVVGGATVHPGDDNPLTLLRTAVEELGLRVLKMHCSVGDFDTTDPRLASVWDYVQEIRLPVVIHAGHNVNGHTDRSEVAIIDETARRYPEAPMIVAHCGHDVVDEVVKMLDARPNVYADLTPVVSHLVAIKPDDAVRLSSKLLFGTDAPNTEISATRCLEHIDEMGLTDKQRQQICGSNAQRLHAAVKD